jgi:transcriptional regulator with XRE-family HTH domain
MPEWRKQTDQERKRLATKLRDAREAAGLNQHEVAVQLGIGSRSIISELEHGQRRLDVVELMALAKIYDRPLAWFLDGEDALKP